MSTVMSILYINKMDEVNYSSQEIKDNNGIRLESVRSLTDLKEEFDGWWTVWS
jgi:hypothetical protein